MSSFYTAAQIEARRKALLKQQLSGAIQKLGAQLQAEHSNTAKVSNSSNIKLSVFADDNCISGNSEGIAVTSDMLRANNRDEVAREALDFSDFLFSPHNKPTKLEIELDSWIHKVDERPVVSEKDENDRDRLLTELTRIVHSSSTDIEDKISSVKMRVTSYLRGAAKLNDAEKAKMESDYYRYCALCQMLGVSPKEEYPYLVKKEIERMTATVYKRKQDEYIMSVIEEEMEKLGCHPVDDAVLDHTQGHVYSVGGNPLCDVFVGNDGSGIMFEPIGDSKDGSPEKRRQIESSANSICSMYGKLEEKVAERGVILKRAFMAPAQIDQMYTKSDISDRRARKQKGKAAVKKQKSLSSEG